MSARLCHAVCLCAALGAGLLPGGFARAQPLMQPAGNATQPPPVPLASKSPVQAFRELLAMNPAEREHELGKRAPAARERILGKVREYESMKPDERELRLRLTQMRWYLMPLLRLPASERPTWLAAVSEADRPLVMDRLQQWDRLPAEERQAVLKYESAMEEISSQNAPAAAIPALAHPAPPLPPEFPREMENFATLPIEQRRQIYASFQRFFELSDAEKRKTLETLAIPVSPQTSNALRTITGLSKPQREEYLQAFNKFSAMSEAERREFLDNASRWRELTPAERQAWRNLINQMPPKPPLPPGLVMPPMPPMPGVPLQASTPTLDHAPR